MFSVSDKALNSLSAEPLSGAYPSPSLQYKPGACRLQTDGSHRGAHREARPCLGVSRGPTTSAEREEETTFRAEPWGVRVGNPTSEAPPAPPKSPVRCWEPLASCLGFKDAGVQTFTANGAVCCLLAGGGTASGLETPPNSFVHEAEKPWNGDGEHFKRRFCTAQLYRRRSRKQHVLSSSLKATEFIQHRQAAPHATPVIRS